ncbi:Sin3-associated polypeptide Sap18 [Pochonia chlamydosporia 170]|uniref:Sin3-associated polypeptide Sap18 n=1 Tax=Pochonia chlamydosporia 170 TaxID=1380566 RepID=A0A179FB46_METCM|nr:Sin3-associated polypeptide Sap18 [Pochonia chlamydosporia 170]OAQ62329.1 Sin3-associated polypeptide Sap18 [Pochonia chlamydosporia 170]
MSSASDNGDRDPPAPFLLQLFYRSGGFFRADEFAGRSLPAHISIYTWPHCTLNELALELAAAKPSALPYPAIGTRLAFQLVCPDLRGVGQINSAHPRYAVKDLGSIVIGQNQQGASDSDFVEVGGSSRGASSSDKTLGEARFVVGDYISCAILPPLGDGSIAPASTARRESNAGFREGRGGRPSGGGGGPGFHSRENGFGRPGGHEGRGGSRGGRRGGHGASMPMGEWRRGERLPDVPPSRPRGGGGRW